MKSYLFNYIDNVRFGRRSPPKVPKQSHGSGHHWTITPCPPLLPLPGPVIKGSICQGDRELDEEVIEELKLSKVYNTLFHHSFTLLV